MEQSRSLSGSSSLSANSEKDLKSQNYGLGNRGSSPELVMENDYLQMQFEKPRNSSPTISAQDDEVMMINPPVNFGGIQQVRTEEVVEAVASKLSPAKELFLQTESEKIEQLQSELSLLVQSKEHTDNECDFLWTLKTEAQQEVARLESKLATLEQRCQDLQAEVARLRMEMTRPLQSMRNLQTKGSQTIATQSPDSKKGIRSPKAEMDILRKDLDACKDDLFRLQPAAQTPDTEIVNDFDSLAENIHTWIEVEISNFEKTNPKARHQKFFSSGGNTEIAKILRKFSPAGEYLVRYEIHRFLQECIMGDDIYLLGLSEEAIETLQIAENSMARLKPPRDTSTINAWRSEALQAFAATKDLQRDRNKQLKELNTELLESLYKIFPAIRNQASSKERLLNLVSVPAANLAVKMQLSASKYTLKPKLPQDPIQDYRDPVAFKRDALKDYTMIDIKTRKTLKADCRAAVDSDGFLGNILMLLDPCLERSSEDGNTIELRKVVYLVELHQPSRKRKRAKP